MISNENLLLDISALDGLSEEERRLALEILKEFSQDGVSTLLDTLQYGDFEEIPVDIDTFLDDDRYLGKGLWEVDVLSGTRRCTIFPYWRETLKKLFPDNLTTAYNTLILTGAIGIGKSFVGVIAMLYLLYRMLCLKDPYGYFGMQPIDKITFSMLNITLDAAQGVAWDKAQQMIQSSSWFMDHGAVNASRSNPMWQPGKHIELIFGSQNRHVVGRALFCLDGETEILTTTGTAKLEDLVNKDIQVISIDQEGNQVISDKCTVEPTIIATEEFQIELEDGTILKCTPNHRFMLKDGTYKEAQYLTEEDELADIQEVRL